MHTATVGTKWLRGRMEKLRQKLNTNKPQKPGEASSFLLLIRTVPFHYKQTKLLVRHSNAEGVSCHFFLRSNEEARRNWCDRIRLFLRDLGPSEFASGGAKNGGNHEAVLDYSVCLRVCMCVHVCACVICVCYLCVCVFGRVLSLLSIKVYAIRSPTLPHSPVADPSLTRKMIINSSLTEK